MAQTITGVNQNKILQQALSTGSSSLLQECGLSFNPTWFLQAVQQYGDAKSSEEKEAVVNSFMNQALTTFSSNIKSTATSVLHELITGWMNKAADATKKVTNSSKNIETAKQRQAQLKQVHDSEIKEILSNVEANIQDIEKLIEELQKLGEEQVKDAEEKIEAEKQNIAKQAEILNDPQKSDEERRAALDALKESSKLIKVLVSNVAGYNAKITEISKKVAEKSEQISKLTEQAIEKTTTTLNEIQGVQAEVTKEGVVNVKIAKDGLKDEAVGVALETKAATEIGASVFTLGISGMAGATDQEKALEYLAAAKTEMAGSGENMSALGVTLGAIGKNTAAVSSDIQAIGYFETQAGLQVGRYNTMASAAIISVGSWDKISSVSENLDQAIADYEDAYELNDDKEYTANTGNEESDQYLNKNSAVRGLLKKVRYNEETQSYENVKFNFNTEDIKIEKLSFGV